MDRYAIIQTERFDIPGDERSRTNPGHGYPARIVTSDTVKTFPTREAWEKWIRDAKNPPYGAPKKFKAIIYREVEVTTIVNIES